MRNNIESMPKRESMVSKVMGATPQEEQEILAWLKKEDQQNRTPEIIRKAERNKTPEEITVIKTINAYMDEFVKEHGGQPIKIPSEKVVFLDEKKITEKIRKLLSIKSTGAVTSIRKNLITIIPSYPKNAPTVKISLAKTLTHEFLHFNSFTSLSQQKQWLKERQSGINIILPEINFLENLNEAIIEEMAVEFMNKYFPRIPILKEDMKIREEYINKLPNEKQEWVRKNITYALTEQLPSGEKITKGGLTAYREEREALQNLLEKIQLANPTEFPTTEDVFKIFASAVMTGNLPQIARLIEQNLGRGAFKKIAQEFSVKHET